MYFVTDAASLFVINVEEEYHSYRGFREIIDQKEMFHDFVHM